MALIYMEISIVSKDFNLGLVLAHITLKETSEWLFLSEYQEETLEIRFESTGTKRKYDHVRDGNDDQYANVTAQGITCFFHFQLVNYPAISPVHQGFTSLNRWELFVPCKTFFFILKL